MHVAVFWYLYGGFDVYKYAISGGMQELFLE